jgi:hypothetical protein
MTGLLSRFGISFLSSHNKNNALPEELMVHKETGQILIKTNDGQIISYDSLARLRDHINATTIMAYNLDICGAMYSISLDSIELPEVVTENSNVFTNPVELFSNNAQKFLVSVDADAVEISNEAGLIEFEPFVKIDLSFKKDTEERKIVVSSLLTKSNATVIYPGDFFPLEDMSGYSLSLTGVTLMRNPAGSTLQVKNILHSVLVVKEGAESTGATGLKHIKSLQDSQMTLLQILKSFVIGDISVKTYIPDRVYKRGELILYLDGNTGKFELLQCISDSTTGPFNISNWEKHTLSDHISGVKPDNFTIMLSESQPTHPGNVMWYQTLRTKDQPIDTDKLQTGTILVFSAAGVTGQDDQPVDPDVKVWFDYEITNPPTTN